LILSSTLTPPIFSSFPSLSLLLSFILFSTLTPSIFSSFLPLSLLLSFHPFLHSSYLFILSSTLTPPIFSSFPPLLLSFHSFLHSHSSFLFILSSALTPIFSFFPSLSLLLSFLSLPLTIILFSPLSRHNFPSNLFQSLFSFSLKVTLRYLLIIFCSSLFFHVSFSLSLSIHLYFPTSYSLLSFSCKLLHIQALFYSYCLFSFGVFVTDFILRFLDIVFLK
jgi:hypothetical protein